MRARSSAGWWRLPVVLLVATGLPGGCARLSEMADTFGRDAPQWEALGPWLSMAWVAAAALGLALAAVSHALFAPRWLRGGTRYGLALVLGGGVLLPVAAVAVLARGGGGDRSVAAAPALTIEIRAWQFWWELRYPRPDGGPPVISANELRIPAGVPVRLHLDSTDVIHGFSVPELGAGTVDVVPGRVASVVLRAAAPGVFRGACYRFCGVQHAHMTLSVVAMPPDDFAAWLAREAEPAEAPRTAERRRGAVLFLEAGCGSCHTLRGLPGAEGRIAPDLTHLGARLTIGAGMLPNTLGSLAGWTAGVQQLKPGANMPNFNQIAGPDLIALAAFLEGLR